MDLAKKRRKLLNNYRMKSVTIQINYWVNWRTSTKTGRKKRYLSVERWRWMLPSRIYPTRRKIFTMIWPKISIAIAEDHPLGKWWRAKIRTANENGSILYVWRRKISLKNGTVRTARSRETKQRIPTRVVTLWISSLMLFDDCIDLTFLLISISYILLSYTTAEVVIVKFTISNYKLRL